MEYNFSSSQNDMLVDVEKKLKKCCINFMDDVNNFIHMLNDQEIVKVTEDMNQEMRDIFRDEINKTVLNFTAALNKVQKVMEQYL